jgi:hypothetical protein
MPGQHRGYPREAHEPAPACPPHACELHATRCEDDVRGPVSHHVPSPVYVAVGVVVCFGLLVCLFVYTLVACLRVYVVALHLLRCQPCQRS